MPTGMPVFCLIFGPPDADLVPAVGLHADLVPEILPVVDRVRDVAVGEAVVLLGPRVVRALDRQVDRLAVLLLALLVDLPVVDDVVLVDRARPEEPEEVMTLLRGDLGRGGGVEGGDADVVDRDLGVVLLAPLLDVVAVEPLVVARDEVVPLQDLQLLLRALSEDLSVRAERGTHGGRSSDLQQLPSGDSHLVAPSRDRRVRRPSPRSRRSHPTGRVVDALRHYFMCPHGMFADATLARARHPRSP